MTIWERRVELDRQERTERCALLASHNAKYLELRRLLMEDCAAEGHSLRFLGFTPDGYEIRRCSMCGFSETSSD